MNQQMMVTTGALIANSCSGDLEHVPSLGQNPHDVT